MKAVFDTEGSSEAPSEASAALTEAIARGDAIAAARCFARDGCLITPDNTAVQGRETIATILRQLSGSVVGLETEQLNLVATGESALLYERWLFRHAAPDARTYLRSSVATLLTRVVEGRWKLAIAAPWGWPQAPQLEARPIAISGKAIMTPR